MWNPSSLVSTKAYHFISLGSWNLANLNLSFSMKDSFCLGWFLYWIVCILFLSAPEGAWLIILKVFFLLWFDRSEILFLFCRVSLMELKDSLFPFQSSLIPIHSCWILEDPVLSTSWSISDNDLPYCSFRLGFWCWTWLYCTHWEHHVNPIKHQIMN